MKRFEPNQIIVREDLDYPDGALIVHGYAEDGSLLAFPKGGGVQLRIPLDETVRFEVVSDDEKVGVFRKARFALEGLDGETFEGWTCGENWNGWEKPYFDRSTAWRILGCLGATAVPTQNGDKSGLKTILDVGNGAEEVEWQAVLLELPDGGSVEVYAVGCGDWMWEEV